MKQRQFVFAIMAMLLCFVSPAFAQNVAKIGETEYTTLSAAIGAASSGGKVTLIDNVSENVTISKNLTVDGAGKQYTGTMTINTGLTVTVEKVNFYNAGIVKASGSKGTITVKDCTFDGAGRTYGYAVKTSGAGKLTIENCTVKDYNFGFLYNSKSLTTHSVKNVTVENCNYGVRMASCNTTNLVNFVTKDVKWPVQIQANAARTVNMTDCSITGVKEGGKSLSCWDGTSTVTFNFKGTNVFDAALPEDANFVYNEDAADEVDNVIIVKPAVAKVGEQGYETLAAAVVAASANQTITLLKDIEEDVTLTKSVTINGASYKYTGTMSANTGITVTVKNVNFVNGGFAKDSKTVSGTYSFIDCTFDGKGTYYYPLSFRAAYAVKVENCTVKDYKYSFLYVRGSVSSYLNVKNVTVENCPEYAVYFASGVANAMIEGLTVENSNIGFRINNTANRSLTIKDCTMVDVETAVNYNGGTKTITCTLQGVNEFGDAVFSQYVNVKGVKVGTKYVATLAEALDIAENGATVTLISDIKLTQGIANSKTITLDLNGKTLSMEDASSATAALITNTGNLTITDSSEAKEGKISFKTTTASANNSYASNTISNRGTITIEAGTIENLSTGGGACYALDNYAGSTATINGGKLVAEKTTVRIFNWTDGEAAKATLNVNGGEIVSNVGYGINVNSGNTPYVALNISGGVITTNDTAYNLAVYVVNKDGAQNFTANVTGGTFNGNFALNGVTSTTMAQDAVSITGGAFAGIICYEEPAYAFVKGGTYTMDVTAYCPEGYVCIENTDGTYTVKYDPAYGNVAKIGTAYYATLTEAVAAAQDGETVVVIDNIALDATVVVDNKTMTLDLNGMTITGTDNNTSGNFYLINNNKGNLTIVDGSEAQSGKITLVATTERNWSASSVVVANNLGTVTLKGGAIKHLGGTSMAYGIDNLTNGANTVATLNIEGGNVASTYFAVRQFANGGTNNLNITGGNVGYAWMQSPNSNANVANISVTGGEVAGICFSGANANVTLNAKVECVGEVYGTMPAGSALLNVDGVYKFVPAVAVIGTVGYASIQDAVVAAKTGATVVIVDDVETSAAGYATITDGYAVIVAVKEKEITLDLNGKSITVNPTAEELDGAKDKMLMSVFGMDTNGKLTLTGNGSVKVNANGANVYSLVAAYGEGSAVVIENGNYEADAVMASGSLIYSHEMITVMGGTFKLGNLATGANGSPWIFNTIGQNYTGVKVIGGTYPTDINHQFWANEVLVPEAYALKNNGDGTWTVVDAVAYTNEKATSRNAQWRHVGYASLEDAIAATGKYNCQNNTVTMSKDITLEPITVANGVKVAIDLNGKTISGTDNATGSYALITNKGDLTIGGTGAITLTATQNRGWSAYSSVISNTVGGKLTVNGGTIEHRGGTSMAYAIDNLTNGKGTYAKTEINGGEIKSTYRPIRMFLNGVEAQNILTVNGGTIESTGGNKAAIWMQTAGDAAHSGTLYVGADAVIKNNVYLDADNLNNVREYPVEAYIAKAAIAEGMTVLADAIPAETAALVEYDTFWQVEQKNLAELTIEDACEEYINKVEKNVGVLTYERYFDDTEWQTIVLPFDVPVANLMEQFEVAYIYNASYKGKQATIDYVVIDENSAVEKLSANYPYLIKAKGTGWNNIVVEDAKLMPTEVEILDCSSIFEKFSFIGNYATVVAPSNDGMGYFNLTSGAWSKMDEVNPFRFYMQIKLRNNAAFEYPTDSQAIRMRSVNANGEETTGINGVDAEQGNDFIFDLHGRRVVEPQKGSIYIVNGKKVMF